MLKTRIIPCLDVNAGRVVKGVNFVNLAEHLSTSIIASGCILGRALYEGKIRPEEALKL